MTDRYLVEQVTSYFGLVFWSLQLAPQGINLELLYFHNPCINNDRHFSSLEDVQKRHIDRCLGMDHVDLVLCWYVYGRL